MTERERILDRIGRFKNSVVMHRHKMTEYPTGSQGHTYHSIMADKLENQIIEFEEELSKLEVQNETMA